MPTLFIDLDGTVVDVRRRHYLVYHTACLQAGLSPVNPTVYWRRRRQGASTFDLVNRPAGRKLQAFREAWMDAIEQPDYLQLDRVYYGARKALGQLAGAGYRLILVTLRHRRATLLQQLELLRLDRCFVQVLSPGDGDGDGKASLIARAGYLPGDAVVGDSEADVQAARSLAITSVCVSGGVRSAAYLRQLHPALIVPSLRDLPPLLVSGTYLPHKTVA